MEVSSTTRPASPPPAKARPAERNRSQDYAAEQQAAARSRQPEHKTPRPVVNTQGQTTGKIVNTRA